MAHQGRSLTIAKRPPGEIAHRGRALTIVQALIPEIVRRITVPVEYCALK